ncbi:MAG: RNA 2',3'-cyclic phosphodiesterase [Anaerolineaceae bacterium]
MMSYRVFTALDLSQSVITDILNYQKNLEKYFPPILRWIKADQLHITLKFVGELHENHLQPLQNKMKEIFSDFEKFQLQFQGSGIFPNERNPRILWVGIQPSQKLLEVVKKNESIFQTFSYPTEKRPFQAHITIARFKEDYSQQEWIQFQLLWKTQNNDFQTQQNMDHLTLYQSTLTRQGPIYKILMKVVFH